MGVSRYGVAYDLKTSPYKVLYGEWEFYFSSMPHRKKFIENLTKRTEWLSDSLSRRFRMTVRADSLAVFQLYQQVETRGFFVRNTSTDVLYLTPDTVEVTIDVR